MTLQPPPLEPAALREFDRTGYRVVPGAFRANRIDELERALVALERCADAELPCPRSWTPLLQECRLLSLVECGPPFEALIDDPALLAWVRTLVPGRSRMTAAWSVTRGPGVGLPLHRIETANYRQGPDGPCCDHLTFAVYLTDCGPEDGPMVVLEGSHRETRAPEIPLIHPAWEAPPRDAGYVDDLLARQPVGTVPRPWEEAAAYRELYAKRGDLVVFAESLWHGAREIRSERTRRVLFYSYSPYHITNWNGVSYSRALLERVTPARRELLSGPFIGSRYPGIVHDGVPDWPEFPRVPDSALGQRTFPTEEELRARDDPARCAARVRDELAAAERRSASAGEELAGIAGTCQLCLANGSAGEDWILRIEAGRFEARPGRSASPDARIDARLQDFVGLVERRLDPLDLFARGALGVRGEMRLAMRVASFLFPAS